MKKFLALVLFFCLFFIFNSFSQTTELKGHTLYNCSVYFEHGKKAPAKIEKKTEVIIINADENYFTIKYNNGIAYLLRNDVSCNLKELRQFENDIEALKSSGKFDKNFRAFTNNEEPAPVTASVINSFSDLKKIDDPYKFEIDHIRHCAWKYNREVMTGYSLTIIGSLLSATAILIEEPEIPVIAGAALSLAGTILVIDGQKWMKRMSIGPNGIGIRYRF